MDPVIQGALTMVFGGLLCAIAARIIVPLLPPAEPIGDEDASKTAAE
jgi:hypothetical protein